MASLMREGQRIRVDFDYSPERVKAIKAIRGASYHPDDKSWSIPRAEHVALCASKEFPPRGVMNGLGPLDTEPLERQEALEELRADPFSVREEVIAAVLVDLLVRINVEKKRIRLIPRIGSDAHKIVKKFPGVTFSVFDTAYVLSSDQMPSLLKKLRDKQVSFCVDSVAGAAMAGSAILRKGILAEPEKATADELSNAMLTPFITEVPHEERAYRPCFFTSEQFKIAFPGVRRQPGVPFLLDESALLRLCARRPSLPFSVWLTREISAFIDSRREQLTAQAERSEGPLDDAAACIITPPLLLKTEDDGHAVLLVNLPLDHDVRLAVLERMSEATSIAYPNETEAAALRIPDSRLLMAVAELDHLSELHGLAKIPRSASFVRLYEDAKSRAKLRERSAYYTSLEDLPSDSIEGLAPEAAVRLFPHQRVAVQWLQETPYAFLGDDMGLGKTLSILSCYSSLRVTQGMSLLLVVCPNSLSRNWLREASMWFPDLKVTVLSGDKGAKAWTLRLLNSGSVEHDIIVVNYEAVRLDYVTPELQKLAGSRSTLLCLDESQRVKNPSAKTFKALNQIAPYCDRRVLLSGTPTPKDVSDLWAQMRILDGGERFGKSFYKWLSTVAELGTEYSQYAVKKFHDDEVAESVARAHEIMLRRRKERVVNLPPKIFSLREVELTGSQAERYEEIRDSLLIRMRTLSGEQFVREITNILEEYLRAVQVSSNPRLIDPEWKGEPAKFLELDEIVTELVREQGQKIVVWTNYLGNVRELCERYKDLGAAAFSGEVSAADREHSVREFQERDSIRILVAVPAAGGVGITLTAAQTAVYIDKTWNAEHWMQSVDRIHRIGQRGTVNIISLLGCKVDEIIHWNLRRKEQGQARVLGDYSSTEGESGGGITREELLRALEN